jgi:hypothetical protein
MATFKDAKGQEWSITLNAPLIEDVIEKHGVHLAQLDKDPLQPLRNDPMTMVAVLYLLCEDQIKERGLSPKDFGRSVPSPPDAILDAISEAIVGFFPSGRASHVREVLTKHGEMASKTDQLMVAKMEAVLADPMTETRLRQKADQEFELAMKEIFSTD